MKTYKKYWAERFAEDRNQKWARKQRALAFLESVKGIAIAKDREHVRDSISTSIINGHAEFLGVACDACGIELVNPVKGEILISSPPKVDARCAGCGFIGYLPAER